MPSNSETGHAKNVANFEDLITRVESLGTAYNPTKAGLQLASLKVKHAEAAASLQNLATALPLYQQAVDARQKAFEPLNKLITRALNMFKASVSNPAEVESATALADKIRGFKAPKPLAKEGEEPVKTVSTSQQSFDMLIANFLLFVEVLAANAAYNPNEEELKITSLQALYAELNTKSQAVTQAQAQVDAARSSRNAQLYSPGNGLVDIGSGVKTYVKAAFTPESSNYKPILSLEFRNP
jgi:multidrug resistance efflux pump